MRKRRPLSRRQKNIRQLWLSIAVGLLLGVLTIRGFNLSLRPAIITIASDHLSNQMSEQISNVISRVLEEEQITYDTVCTIQRDDAGNIKALQADMTSLNQLGSCINTDIAEEFDTSLRSETIHVPIGSLVPGILFSGRGPSFDVVVLSVGDISAQFDNQFIAKGINQTLHQIVLTVSVKLSLLLPGGVYTFTDQENMVLAETILLGDVPESYTKFNGLVSAKDAYYYTNTEE